MPYHKDKKNKRSDKYVDLPNLNIYYTWKKKKKFNKFKIAAPTWNDKFKLPDESYFVSDIQNDIHSF